MRRHRSLGFLIAALPFAFTGAASAAEMVVIEASGVKLAPGSVVDGNDNLTLPAGAKITLIGQDGTPVQLVGPYDGKPGAGTGATGGNNVVGALAQLLGGGDEKKTNIGATRNVQNTQFALPDPRAVPTGRSGDYCVVSGGPTFLWRLNASQPVVVTLRAADGSWEGKQPWAAGQNRLPLPPNFPSVATQAFKVTAGTESSDIVLHKMPGGLQKTGLRAAWLASKGCDLQAKAMLAKLQ